MIGRSNAKDFTRRFGYAWLNEGRVVKPNLNCQEGHRYRITTRVREFQNCEVVFNISNLAQDLDLLFSFDDVPPIRQLALHTPACFSMRMYSTPKGELYTCTLVTGRFRTSFKPGELG